MAVVARKRKQWTAYYVVFNWQGAAVWEPAGRDRRAAEALDRRRAKEVENGTYHPDAGQAGSFTLRQWFESWIATRENRSKDNEERWVRRHVLTRKRFADLELSEARPTDFKDLAREIRTAPRSETDVRPLSSKSIANIMGVLSVMFADAHRGGHCSGNPVNLSRKTLKRDPERARETYTVAEVVVLIRNEAIPEDIRVLNALCFLGGLREGEACGRRWRDLEEASPLWSLSVVDQYGSAPLKTDRPRVVPVHPELLEILGRWARGGFELLTTRQPGPDDFIVPLVTARSTTPHHTRSTYYKAFVRACKAVKIRARSLHSTRHTFVSMARRAGAPKDVVERITHNAKGDIVDRYTHFDWAPLCDAVLKISLDLNAHQGLQPGPGKPGGSGVRRLLGDAANAGNMPPLLAGARGSIPRASTPIGQKNSGSENGVNFGVKRAPVPARLQRAVDRSVSLSHAGALARRLRGAYVGAVTGDEASTLDHLRAATRLVGGGS